MIRLSKYIADAGICSRRQASRLIESGCVLVNGRQGLHIDRIKDGDCVLVSGQEIQAGIEKVYFLYNKSVGVDSVCDFEDSASIVHYLPDLKDNRRVFPVGRLDKDSHGLMLLTNHGELCQKLMHPDFYHEKEYLVRVDRPFSEAFLVAMAAGVQYGKITTKPCRIRKVEDEWFKITLTQGLNRQIRRMSQSLGYRVMDLQRIRMVNLQLGELALNKHRELKEDEVAVLLREAGHQ
ncbi:pseudouridine synthase [Endozoicomonas sp.]|uniref:pseudouridine synthase n=1 Tax=Endozoicomonas sp. TaxID=1892382 RepID=UPI00288490C9|nr:pseudouridine synthase [Endozoicomonas sp.]